MVHQLSRRDARRIAARAQLLDAPRPADLLAAVRHLTVLQVDLTAAVAPSADLVCWSRLGESYRPEDLEELRGDGSLVELRGMLRPAEDIALFRAEMAAFRSPEPLGGWEDGPRAWVAANEAGRREVLAALRADGPLAARDLPDACDVPWRSTGWSDGKNVVRLLDFMESRGEVAVVSREGRERLWDLAERVYSDDPDAAPPAAEALAERERRRLASLGIARSRSAKVPGEPHDVGQAGEPAVVEGLRGTWRVDPAQLERLEEPFGDRTVLLSPLDRLVFDRKRTAEVLDFDYQLEMYKPAARRRWGYYALPVLHGDRLVGKVDATADRAAGVLWVDAVHEDEPLPPPARADVDREVAALAAWLGLEPSAASARRA